MKTRLLFGLIATLGFAYFGHSWWQTEQASKERQAIQQAKRQAQLESVTKMAINANAITNWPERLSNEKRTRTSPVMTSELQQLWLVDRPILFIGKIRDAARNPDGTYQINIHQESFDGPVHFLQNEFRLSLRCHSTLVAGIIETMKTRKHDTLWPDIAVAAAIERVERSIENSMDDRSSAIQLGIGKCVEVLQLTERLPRNSIPLR
jgi:hypothetical protein